MRAASSRPLPAENVTPGLGSALFTAAGLASSPVRPPSLRALAAGNGARIAVICTITPATTQAEETHNTLKFASRQGRRCDRARSPWGLPSLPDAWPRRCVCTAVPPAKHGGTPGPTQRAAQPCVAPQPGPATPSRRAVAAKPRIPAALPSPVAGPAAPRPPAPPPLQGQAHRGVGGAQRDHGPVVADCAVPAGDPAAQGAAGDGGARA